MARQRLTPPTTAAATTQDAPESVPQMPLPGYPHSQLQQQLAMNAAALQALIYAQQHPGWAGVDPAALRMAYGGTLPFHPGAAIPGLEYPAFPGLQGNALLPQQILAMHQAQLALYPGFAHPPSQPSLSSPPAPAEAASSNDPFVYVQPEVKAAQKEADRGVPAEIKKRALFVAPPARLRIAQACERCRKRKTKCTGDKPQCARCARRGFECEYVEEHRANRTKQAIAARQQAAMEAGAEACNQEHVPLVDPLTLPICPPARHTYSSSSAYSDATTSSLPSPLGMPPVPHGQPLYNLAAPSFSSSGFSDGSSLPSAMSTPAITLDGGPLPANNFNASRQTVAPRPTPKARASAQGKRPSPAKSMVDLRAASKSRSAPLPEYSEVPMHMLAPTPTPTPSTSCRACLAEMSNCSGCVEGGPLRPEVKHFSPSHNRSHSMPPPLESAEFPPLLFGEPAPEVKQILIDVLSKTLTKQAAIGVHSTSTLEPTAISPAGPPPLSRDASTSSSCSEALSGALTPPDYFTFPSTREAGVCALSPAGYGEAVPVKRSESMMMTETHHGMHPSPPTMGAQAHVFSTNAEGALQFSEVFHSYSSISESLSAQE
ncbi:hypothetical protein C8Q79DRAFT_959199 [Trametes meyenii]|nr:hypothetical protein C8Q79DRAFT_959199 [Trametes meyenii]